MERLADFIQKEWGNLKKAPSAFVMLSVLFLSAGYTASSLYYRGQIDTLHEQLNAKDGQIGRYRVALGVDPASKGALVELSNQELALKAQAIVAKLRDYTAMATSNNEAIDKRLKTGKIDQAEALKEQQEDLQNLDRQFDSNLASDTYNVENELRSRLTPSIIAHIVRAPAFIFGSDPRSRVTFADMFRGTPMEISMLGPLANEMEQMAKLLPPDSH